jgi:hypothetical protein
VGEQAVQLHGGMGMSNELKVGHYLKRLVAINIQYGDPAFHILRRTEDVFGSESPVAPDVPLAVEPIANVA